MDVNFVTLAGSSFRDGHHLLGASKFSYQGLDGGCELWNQAGLGVTHEVPATHLAFPEEDRHAISQSTHPNRAEASSATAAIEPGNADEQAGAVAGRAPDAGSPVGLRPVIAR